MRVRMVASFFFFQLHRHHTSYNNFHFHDFRFSPIVFVHSHFISFNNFFSDGSFLRRSHQHTIQNARRNHIHAPNRSRNTNSKINGKKVKISKLEMNEVENAFSPHTQRRNWLVNCISQCTIVSPRSTFCCGNFNMCVN